LLTADPRVVPDARLIPVLHVREASELAYYGANCAPALADCAAGGTRLIIRPYADPTARGTEIVVERERKPSAGRARRPVKALTAIADQTLLTIAGNGMVGVPGVAARAFGALERAGVSVSLISQASSEHSICVGIPSVAANAAAAALREAFASELARREIDAIEVRPDLATIAVVGLGMAGTPGVAARLFGALADEGVNIVAIAQGASELNISVVVEGQDAGKAQRAIHSAFRLGKIGGGAAVHPEHADVVILGFGQIGRELASQMATHSSRAGDQVQARVVGVIDRSGYVFDARGLSAKGLETLIAAKAARTPLSGVRRGVHATADEAIAAITAHALSRPILVDVTAGDTEAVLEQALSRGMDLVLANKRPLAGPEKDARALARAAAADGRRVLHEATVGAGLPVIDTIQKLTESGDHVLRIEACPSGTLGYLLGAMGRGTSFSKALRSAMDYGYTEPDPRDDLSGMDVARKALILGRMIGFSGELTDVEVESLVPDALRDAPLDVFLNRLPEADAPWEQRVHEARDRGTVLRYRATVTKREARVGIVAVDASSSLASLAGTDNHFSFTTPVPRQPAGDHRPGSGRRRHGSRRAQRHTQVGGHSLSPVIGNRLHCDSCGSELGELDARTTCPKCGGLLSVEIALPSKRGAALRELFDERLGAARAGPNEIPASGVWRFRELVLPGIADRDLVTQCEGNTPLLARERVAHWAGVPELLLKHEGHNPTGSFKDRGMTVAVSQAMRSRASAVSCASTGNTSASLAAYAALAEFRRLFYARGTGGARQARANARL
jgi:aspartokinase/homoserine dehydrogenase 1